MSPELVVSVFAVAVSLISFEVNRRAAKAAERHGRMPVLTSHFDGPSTLVICNVGNGPAVNVVLADAPEGLATTDLRKLRVSHQALKGTWENFRHLRPLQPHTEYRYTWVPKGALGVTYNDALGETYTLLSSRYGTKIIDGTAMPYKPFVDKADSEMAVLFEQ